MSTATSEARHDSADPGEVHTHGPSDQQYFKIFWVLVVLTALEVSTHWWEDWFGENGRTVAIPLLIILMVIKFFLVGSYFMHLKYDSKMLSRVFYGGLILALILFTAALTSLNFWTDWGNPWIDNPAPAPPTTLIQSDTPGG